MDRSDFPPDIVQNILVTCHVRSGREFFSNDDPGRVGNLPRTLQACNCDLLVRGRGQPVWVDERVVGCGCGGDGDVAAGGGDLQDYRHGLGLVLNVSLEGWNSVLKSKVQVSCGKWEFIRTGRYVPCNYPRHGLGQ